MAAANKQQLFDKTLAALKKKYPAPKESSRESARESDARPILEEVIYAILREGNTAAQADAAFAKLKEEFHDWNEIRVSSVQEIADALAGLSEAGTRAMRMIDFLQEHFERTYSFELDDLEKKGVKQAAKQLARYKDKGVNDYAVAWVTQRSLGGHAVPLDAPSIRVLTRLHLIENECEDLEATRASVEHHIAKSKAQDFIQGIVLFAEEFCTESAPKCNICPLKADCPTAQEAITKAKPSKPKGK